MKVYVITSGEYSDYKINAVAIDPDRAELLRKLYSSGFHEARIEEYDTEADTEKISRKITPIWLIRINAPGDIRDVRQRWNFDEGFQNHFYFPYWENGGFYADVCHEDRDVAIKIALDTRAKMLAEKFGL